jgi:hypothetical protein
LSQIEASIFGVIIIMIDLVSAGVIFGFCAFAFFSVIRTGSRLEAHSIVARGALLGLSIKTIGALLKAIELQTWDQILMFCAIFALKTALKSVFTRENRLGGRPEQYGT